jgi:hypothetical protein
MDLDTLCKQLSASVTQQLEASIRQDFDAGTGVLGNQGSDGPHDFGR